ncbi:GroES-like zinc-binding alcohol dehydrogenase family protein [Dorcoceras hygrometricum]|uniref:GroES-like zinc-binding alcohol dehydrogenase family protein n=1 Tax=Dorcoceras hygrometricum TaxID=472368 RepID=A0A2Z6ZSQ3_9LAMI|nr:GroES-like zinc-binding alcohol dehydrogenase family protein [Dorcoceras hygrometricum]
MKKELEDTQVALEASHKVIARLTEIGLSMSKRIEKMKVKKQLAKANHVECHQKFQARIHEAEDSMQAQHLIIEALVDEKDSLLQTIQVSKKLIMPLLHSMVIGRKNRKKNRKRKRLRIFLWARER